jgi:hypothetical protein
MKSKILETLAKQRAQIEARLVEERDARDHYALEAASGSQEAQRGLEECEKEVARLELQLQRNDGARRHAEVLQSADGVAQVRANVEQARKRATEQAVARIELAKRIDQAFATAGALLKEWRAATAEIAAELRVMVGGAEGLSDRQRMNFLEQIQGSANGPASAALKSAIKGNGIGAPEGVFSDEVHSIATPSKAISFVDAAELAADQVATKFNRLREAA